MPRKGHISNPIQYISNPRQYQTEHPETQLVEAALFLAKDIKNKNVSTIQHNKAAKAMDYLDSAVDHALQWYNQHMQEINRKNKMNLPVNQKLVNELESVRNTVVQLLTDQAGPDSQLGQWLNHDRNASQKYQSLMAVMGTQVNTTSRGFVSQIIPRRLAKALGVENKQPAASSVEKFQDFKQRSAKNNTDRLSQSTTSTDSESTNNSPSRRSSK